MTSPLAVSPFRRAPFLHHDESSVLAGPRGHGALTTLLHNRSSASLHRISSPALDEEEGHGTGAGIAGYESDDLIDSPRRSSEEQRRLSAILHGPHMRSMRLIGRSNPRYRWERYWKTEDELRRIKKPKIRRYYERTNVLIQQYLYIDRLLDSSLPHDLLNEYSYLPHSAAAASRALDVPDTIREESLSAPGSGGETPNASDESPLTLPQAQRQLEPPVKRVKRTPKDIYRPSETTPLFKPHSRGGGEDGDDDDDDDDEGLRFGYGGTGRDRHENHGLEHGDEPKATDIPWLDEDDEDIDSGASIVTTAIYINLAANVILLAGKIAVIIRVPSVSVLASLVDAVLDFLSTAIVWITTWLIQQQDQYQYPVGRRRLEPIGVLVFSVIMITSFAQVALQAIQHLLAPDHAIIQLGIPAIAIMLSTIVVKGLCWVWCRLVKNSSVQALADDAYTDVIFNAGSIAFPIVGFYARVWWLDALGGLLLSLVVIFRWTGTSFQHIKNLCGFSATADQRNILLYLTMRFARTIKKIQGLQAYHAGDKLNVEVDIVLDQNTSLKDSHDLSESLQYVLESVPIVDRAFVHVDYASYNLPTHMEQQAR